MGTHRVRGRMRFGESEAVDGVKNTGRRIRFEDNTQCLCPTLKANGF